MNSLSTAPNEPSTPKSFGRTISDAFRNRPKLFQTKLTSEVSHPFTKIFCEDPYRMVCEVSMDEINAESWPNEIFPRQAEGAFGAGKKILSYLTEHYFDYNEASKRAVLSQLENTQILITNTAGPMAFSTPPHIEVPPTYWNLFSVFHELGHMIDFKVTFPTQKAEIIQVIRHTASTSNLDQLDAQISAKQAEITADKITAKGFAFLADPQIKNLGYQPMSSLSLLKTLKSALGFLCNSPGGTEHPSGKFRINYISRDPDLRTVMGCPVAQTK
ncbi:MAG: hypothetical protein ACKOA8_19610 [Deltaproteobacteria bacterium]